MSILIIGEKPSVSRAISAVVGAIIANNEKRIQAIREVKIPKRQEKIDQGWKKIDTLTAKRDRIDHKLNRVIALNDTIKSFGIHFNNERHEVFADAITRLNSSPVPKHIMESLAENPFVPQEMRENATAELEKMRKQL